MNETELREHIQKASASVEGSGNALCELVGALPGLLLEWEQPLAEVLALESAWATAAAILIEIDILDRRLRDRAREVRDALKGVRRSAEPIVNARLPRQEGTKNVGPAPSWVGPARRPAPLHPGCCAEARWIAAETGLDVEDVHRVLVYDMRYLQALGIASGPPVEDHEVQEVGA